MSAVVVIFILLILIAVAGGAFYLGYFNWLGDPASKPGDPGSVTVTGSTPIPSATSDISSTPSSDSAAVPTPPPETAVPPAAAVVPPPPDCATDPAGYYYYYAPDVKAAGMDALTHWNAYGYNEGRKSCYPAPVAAAPPPPVAAPPPPPPPVAAPPPPSPAWVKRSNTAYDPGTLPRNNIIGSDIMTTADSCKAKCSSTSGCQGFVYQARGTTTMNGKHYSKGSCVYTNIPLTPGYAASSDSYYLQ
jgi:hypothetical protein